MSTEIGRNWVSRIPSLSDNANIQQAFRMYHYGNQDGSEPAPGDTINGIEGLLASLQAQIASITAGVDTIKDLTNDTNLNDLDTVAESGTYRRSSAPPSNLNYPELSAGILFVAVTDGGAVYQEYQTLGGPSGTNNYYWRGRNAAGSWSDWSQASKAGHNHDSLYYRKAEIDARITEQPSLNPSSVLITDAQRKIGTSSTISTTELSQLDGVTSNIQSQLNDRYTKGETARIFVQQSQPISPQVNDLWFW
jgi:hypothetical protein